MQINFPVMVILIECAVYTVQEEIAFADALLKWYYESVCSTIVKVF